MRTQLSSPEPEHHDPVIQRAWEAWRAMTQLSDIATKHPVMFERLFDALWTKNARPIARRKTYRFLSGKVRSLEKQGVKTTPELITLGRWVNETEDQLLSGLLDDPEEQ